MKKALLLSSSGYKDTGYLTHAKDRVNEFLKPCKISYLSLLLELRFLTVSMSKK